MTEHDPIDALVAGLRQDVPEMSREAFDAGRGRLAAVLTPERVTTGPEPVVAVARPGKRRLLRSPPRKLAVSAAAVVALAGGVFVVQAARPDGAVPVASATAQLNAAAARIDPTDQPIAPGQYRYVAWHSWELSTTMLIVPGDLDTPIRFLEETTNETWVPADDPASCTERQTRSGDYRWLAGDEEQAKRAGLVPPAPRSFGMSDVCTVAIFPMANQNEDEAIRGPGGAPSAEFMTSLPRDPAQLYELLRADTSPYHNPDVEVLSHVSITLFSGIVPADLRAALYEAIALIPGLEVTEQVANLDGRKGTAFGLSRGGTRLDVIIDPDTGQFIGEREVDESGDMGVPPGTVVSYSSMTTPVVVDTIGATD